MRLVADGDLTEFAGTRWSRAASRTPRTLPWNARGRPRPPMASAPKRHLVGTTVGPSEKRALPHPPSLNRVPD